MIGHAAAIWKKIDGYARKFEIQFEKRGIRSPFRRDRPLKERVSIVTPLYNVALYLDEFLASLTSQSTGLRNVEIILVDDGSTDQTPEIAMRWQRRFPGTIRYIRKENGGAASARNHGLQFATGKWVTFPDPDDFLSRNYFAVLSAELERRHLQPLLFVSFKLVFYHEETGRRRNSHPLRHRYKAARTELSSWEIGDFIQHSVATACFDREAIAYHGLLFDERVKPTFEDGNFVNRLILKEPRRSVVFTNRATYYYRKRSNQSSALDGSAHSAGWYTDQLEYGYLALLEEAEKQAGYVPQFLQTTILYEVFWRYRHLLGHDHRAAFLTSDEQAKFRHLLRRIFSFIDEATINGQRIGGLFEEHKIALLGMYKSANRPAALVFARNADISSRMAQFAVFSSTGQEVKAFCDGSEVEQKLRSRSVTRFLGDQYYTEFRFWVECGLSRDLNFTVGGNPAVIRVGPRVIGETISILQAARELTPRPLSTTVASREARTLRSYAVSADARRKYAGCWLLMDRDDLAGDNAEHMYRHIMKTAHASQAFFVLRETSADWDRLAADGFRLIPYGSADHFAALVNAELLASSDVVDFVMWPTEKAWLRDLVTYDFVFLQHGVTHNDLSTWLNQKSIRLMITSTPDEFRSITDEHSQYLLTEREVVLTGFARHDALLSGKRTHDFIMIMPTWRKSLSGAHVSIGMKREKSNDLVESEYFKNWKSIIHSRDLKSAAESANKTLVFSPHPNMIDYIDDFEIPSYFKVVGKSEAFTVQYALRGSALFLTDYSSVAFDAALLNIPTV